MMRAGQLLKQDLVVVLHDSSLKWTEHGVVGITTICSKKVHVFNSSSLVEVLLLAIFITKLICN